MESFSLNMLALSMQTIWSALLMALGFGLVIFIHELGHFVAAKLVGIRAEEFAIGFGPKLIGVKYGETEYRLNIFPLGGYVKMTGQEDSTLYTEEGLAKDDPKSFNNKPIWARMVVVSAGVVMNIILAAILFVIIFTYGRQYNPSIVGGLTPGYPAESCEVTGTDEKGLRPGDEIIAIDGDEIYDFNKLQITAILSGDDESHKLTIRRAGVEKNLYATVPMAPMMLPTGSIARGFGISPALTNEVGIDSDPFKTGDIIIGIGDEEIEHGWQIDGAISRQSLSDTIDVKVKRGEEILTLSASTVPVWSHSKQRRSVTQQRKAEEKPPYKSESFHVAGLVPRVKILDISEGSPADKSGIKSGDVIVVFGPELKSVSFDSLTELCQKHVREEVDIRIERDGKLVDDINKIKIASYKGKGRIGVATAKDIDSLILGEVKTDSVFAGSLSGGDRITAINGQAVANWFDLLTKLSELDEDSEFSVSFVTPGGAEMTTEPVSLAELDFNSDDYAIALDDSAILLPQTAIVKSSNPVEALKLGVEETGNFIVNTYATLSAFFSGNVSGKEFSGPIGIFSMGVQVGKTSNKHLLWLLAIISANLAVINFLPLPIVDGGLALMLLIEKLRGKPLSVQVQNIIQVAGLVMIIIVFILLTYNDLARLLSSRWSG